MRHFVIFISYFSLTSSIVIYSVWVPSLDFLVHRAMKKSDLRRLIRIHTSNQLKFPRLQCIFVNLLLFLCSKVHSKLLSYERSYLRCNKPSLFAVCLINRLAIQCSEYFSISKLLVRTGTSSQKSVF